MFINLTNKEFRKVLNETYLEEKKGVLDRADSILRGEFIFQNDWDMERSHESVLMNIDEMDWNYSPTPDLEWSYMLHRQSYLMDLVLAYSYTQHELYLETLYDFIQNWIDDNPYNDNNKMYSWRTLDTAIRINNWIRIKEIIKINNRPWPQKIQNSLDEQANFIFKNFDMNRAQSNWLAIESSAYLVYSFDQDVFDKNYQSTVRVFQRCLELQVLSDGLQWEQSFMYHHQVLISLLQFIKLSQNYQKNVPKIILEKAKKMHQASLSLIRVDGKQTNFGDSDYEDMCSLMLASEKILKEVSFQTNKKSKLFDFLLTGDPRDSRIFKEKQVIEKYELKESGLAFVKHHRKQNNFLFSYGSVGGGHGHDDFIHFEWFVDGKEMIVDSGRFTYYEENNSRIYFKGAKAHNTIILNDKNYNRHIDSWSSDNVSSPMNQKVSFGQKIDFFEGGHFSYSTVKEINYVNRKMILIDNEILCIFDELLTRSEQIIQSNFIFSPDNLKIKDNRYILTNQNYEIKALNNLTFEKRSCYISTSYNLKAESDRLIVGSTQFNRINKIVILPKDKYIIEKLNVYDDCGKKYDDEIVEAYSFTEKKKERILVIQHREPKDSRRAYFVANHMIYGRIVYFEKIQGEVICEEKVF